jgi:serine/threonine protein kinase
MTKDRWERIQRMFNEVADLPLEERQQRLDHECADDPILRKQVESLLIFDGGDLLEQAVGRAAQQATQSLPTPEPEPQTIAGKFRLIRVLGEGGMGIVYEAEQANPRRKVALKVMRGGKHASERHRRLLQREAEALGRLQHPGIATIFESGVTEDSEQPYLAMELVAGETLQDYLTRTKPPARVDKDSAFERIQLFLAIAGAIHYAHLNGVIHRDIKPGNIILPTPDPSTASASTSAVPVKVLDFGLARIAETDDSMTKSGVIQGSIPYMSPEQVRGDSSKIDLRTDIYALGVLLYELLTGKHPYFTENVGLVEGATLICNEPPKPFRTWGAPYDEDLETIVFKALEKEPAQRYQSVLALSEDIQRYLHNMPIQARPPSTIYQLRKLISRHRLAFAASLALVVLLIAFTITTIVQTQRIRAERDRANLEAAAARQVSDFLGSLFRKANTNRNSSPANITVQELLDQGSQRLEKELADQPEIRARLLEDIANAYNTTTPYEKAVSAAKQSIEIRQKLYGPGGSELEAQPWGILASIRHNQGNYKEAAEASLRALEIRRKYQPESDAKHVGDLVNAAAAYNQLGDFPTAERYIKEAVELDRKYGRAKTREFASVLDTYAGILRRNGDFRGALPMLRESLELKQGKASEIQILTTMNEIGLAANLGGDPEEAVTTYRKMLELAPKFFGPDHPNICILRSNIAASLNLLGRHKEAEQSVREGLAKFLSLPEMAKHPQLADFYWALAESLAGQGKSVEADSEFRMALQLYTTRLGPRDFKTANAHHQLARNEIRLGRGESALKHAQESVSIIEELKRTGTPAYGMAQLTTGMALQSLNRKAEARPYLERAQQLLSRLLEPGRVEMRMVNTALARQ